MELVEKIKFYSENSHYAFHTPNHIGRSGFNADLTELPGLDNIEYPEDSIKKAQAEIAEYFNAEASFFLTNGASLGLQAALQALKIDLLRESRDLKPVLLARNIHKSVLSAIIQTGFDIEFLELFYDDDLDLYTGLDFSKLNSSENYSALVITNPSYEGFYSEIPKQEIPVIVDEAHGAHYYFSEYLPAGALNSGADIVIQSWHKCLTALTQGAVAHVNKKSKISKDSFHDALRLLQSTSPSYLILKSLCEAFLLFKKNGEELLANLKHITSKIPELIKATSNHDFTRLILKLPNGINVEDFDAELEKSNIYCESYSNKSILFFLSVFHEKKDIDYLIEEYFKIEKKLAIAADKHMGEELKNINLSTAKQILNPQKAFFSPFELVNLAEAEGYISADYFALCPPGFPITIPGQIITRDIIEKLQLSKEFMNLQDGKIKVLLRRV